MLNVNELEFFRKKRYYKYPKTMQIEITTACPLRCPQCFIDDFNAKYMPTDNYIKLVDEAAQLGVKGVVLFGGEPLLHNMIVEFASYAIRKNITVFIYTSGWNIEKLFSLAKENRDKLKILVSLNGSTKNIHELSRDNYDLTISAMQKLQENGITYGVNWVSRHDNIDDLENVIQVAKTYAASYVNIVGNKISSNYQVIEPLTKLDYQKLLKVYRNNIKYLRIENCNAYLQNLTNQHNAFAGCTAGILNCSVTIDGSFVPCLRLIYPEVFSSIEEYWNHSMVLKKLREDKKGENDCLGCQYKNRCKYCKALSKTTYFDFNAGISNCVIRGFKNE